MKQVFCKHLRTKQMYVLAQPQEALERAEDEASSPCYFWCNRTLAVTGPDDRPAHKESCNSSRRCFEE